MFAQVSVLSIVVIVLVECQADLHEGTHKCFKAKFYMLFISLFDLFLKIHGPVMTGEARGGGYSSGGYGDDSYGYGSNHGHGVSTVSYS